MSEYERLRASFHWECPEQFNFARDVLDHWAERQPDQAALLWVDDHGHEEQRSFTQVSANSRRIANVLTALGVRRGDCLIVVLGRQIAWWETMIAGIRMGAVLSPGTAQLSPKDLAYRIEAARAVCIVTDAANAAKVDAIAAQCTTLAARVIVDGERDGWTNLPAAMAQASAVFDTVDTRADEDALCYFTSGTTGYPKLCMQPHSYPLAHRITGEYWLALKPGDLHWNASDTGWAKAAWSSIFGPWNCGATVFAHHGAFNARRTLQLLSQYPVTSFCGAPTMYRMFVLEDLASFRFPALRHCVGAGEPLNPEVISAWKAATGLVIHDGYGQTESVILCGNFPGVPVRYGSMGRPSPGIELAVIDHDGTVLPEHTEGDVAVRVTSPRPPGLFREYRGNPEKTAACFRGEWYVTGDRAWTDEDGYFWFVGRADDVILSAGYRIGPFEVESALIEHPAVAESAVVSSPDEKRGEVVKAFVVLAPGFEPGDELAKALQEHVRNVTAPYKYPRKIEFVRELPKTVSGKIRRVELRAREWGA